MMMSLLERLNHAFSGGIMFVQPTAEKDYDYHYDNDVPDTSSRCALNLMRY